MIMKTPTCDLNSGFWDKRDPVTGRRECAAATKAHQSRWHHQHHDPRAPELVNAMKP
jgi:hypothetical protein